MFALPCVASAARPLPGSGFAIVKNALNKLGAFDPAPESDVLPYLFNNTHVNANGQNRSLRERWTSLACYIFRFLRALLLLNRFRTCTATCWASGAGTDCAGVPGPAGFDTGFICSFIQKPKNVARRGAPCSSSCAAARLPASLIADGR